jgi:hypothetical protein
VRENKRSTLFNPKDSLLPQIPECVSVFTDSETEKWGQLAKSPEHLADCVANSINHLTTYGMALNISNRAE